MKMTVGEIAALVGGTVIGDPNVAVSGINGIREAVETDLTFLADAKYERFLATTAASAVLVPPGVTGSEKPLIQVADPRLALFAVLQKIEREQAWRPAGIHPSAIIGERVQLGNNVAIDALVVVGDDSVLADGVTLCAGSVVGRECVIGPETILYQNVTVRERVRIGAHCILHSGVVIGTDGFGFAEQGGVQIKIPQVGTVVIGDNVEIGANSCVDRATIGTTLIGSGTKIDNLVQIGHNVQLGRNCIVCGNAGIAGSAVLGDNVVIGAGSGVAGHIEVGAGTKVAGMSGVTKSTQPGSIVSGFPAVNIERHRRKEAALRQLPDALRRIKTLEQRIAQLEGTLNGTPKDDC